MSFYKKTPFLEIIETPDQFTKTPQWRIALKDLQSCQLRSQQPFNQMQLQCQRVTLLTFCQLVNDRLWGTMQMVELV